MIDCPRNKSFADVMVGAGVRLMVRGCLPMRGSDRMTWMYDDDKCWKMERGCKGFERWYGGI